MSRVLDKLERIGLFIGKVARKTGSSVKSFLSFMGDWCEQLLYLTTRLRSISLGVIALLALIAGVGFAGFKLWKSDLPLIFRDASIALVASDMQGKPIPVDPDYLNSKGLNPTWQWGTVTNSEWLWERARNIVPYFEYEGLARKGVYPSLVIFAPRAGISSLKVGGWAWPPSAEVFINEAKITMPMAPADEAEIVGTLVHELIHIQGGHFFTSPEDIGAMGSPAWSEWIESHTTAATIEILAGMCIYGDPAACNAFWSDIESFARSSLKYRLMSNGIGGVYEWFADAFLRDADEERKAEKGMRYWEDNMGEMIGILDRYGRMPWEEYVIPAISRNIKLDTGIRNCQWVYGQTDFCTVMGLEFDDTQVLFGVLKWLTFLGQ